MSRNSPFALPHLNEIFDNLRRGRHLCAEDGGIYLSLRENLDAFQDLFKHLGFRLEVHPRDFFYFRGKDSLSPQASRMALFVFILIESLADHGNPIVDTLMTQTFSIPDLPHLKAARFRTYLKESGVVDGDGLLGIVRQLDRFGFCQRLSDNTFRFRAPAYRFFDLCLEVLKQHEVPQTEEQTT
ncbi:MAG: hypothetical protein BM485_04425 [Desulfobulbaceae bacterium DB1]|nr:MAG: hypothetical protein BM485_04425 [Desulfobulbaceae bacterium DB1]